MCCLNTCWTGLTAQHGWHASNLKLHIAYGRVPERSMHGRTCPVVRHTLTCCDVQGWGTWLGSELGPSIHISTECSDLLWTGENKNKILRVLKNSLLKKSDLVSTMEMKGPKKVYKLKSYTQSLVVSHLGHE